MGRISPAELGRAGRRAPPDRLGHVGERDQRRLPQRAPAVRWCGPARARCPATRSGSAPSPPRASAARPVNWDTGRARSAGSVRPARGCPRADRAAPVPSIEMTSSRYSRFFPERPLARRLRQVAVRGHDDAHVDGARLRRTHGPHRPVLQHVQQLRLQRRRHLADLVEEQRAAMGLDEQPRALAGGARERSARVTEQLALQQGLGQRRAVHRYEGPRRRAGCRR